MTTLDWQVIDTVLLDMDGTLLDLHFDNFFWQEHLPQRYAEIKGLDPQQTRHEIQRHTDSIRGSLDWYSTDYWTDYLGVDVVRLKHEISHRVALRPYCIEFLDALRASGKDVVMVTNAHHDSLALKMEITMLTEKFHSMITVHEFSLPKENPQCWDEVNKRHPFDRSKTLLIDDNLAALHSARQYGIRALLAIQQPDSQRPGQVVEEFDAIDHFDEILPVD